MKHMGIDPNGKKYPYWVMVAKDMGGQQYEVIAADNGVVVFHYETWDEAFADGKLMFDNCEDDMIVFVGDPIKGFHRQYPKSEGEMVDMEPKDGDPF